MYDLATLVRDRVALMMLDPVSLRLFVSTVEEKSIAAAADRENIAAAAVSKRIGELEAVLNARLLVRSNKGITPTAAGLALLYLARGVLNDLDGIVDHMKDHAEGRRGAVHLLANISAITQFLPDLLKTFNESHPLIQVSLEERESLAITKGVAENLAEIGVFTLMPHGAALEVYPFRTDELVLLVPARHPLAASERATFGDTLDFEYICLHGGTHLNYQMINAASNARRSLKVRMHVSSYDALCLMVRAGLGIGLLPKISASFYSMPDTKVLTFDEAWAHRELAICVRSRQSLSAAGKLLFEHLIG